jgi:predicted porin
MTCLLMLLLISLGTIAQSTESTNNVKYEVYGVAHVSGDVLDSGESSSLFLSSNSSRIGFRGDSTLNENLGCVWQVECDASLDEAGGEFASRNSYVGLSSQYGDLIAGRHDTAFEVLSDRIAMFRDQVGDARNIIGNQGVGWNLRSNNIIGYRSPCGEGLQVFALYVPEEDIDNTDIFSASAAYEKNNFFFIVAGERHGKGLLQDEAKIASPTSEFGIRAAARYELSSFKVTAMYESLSDVGGVPDAKSTAWWAGAVFVKGKNALKAQFVTSDGLSDVDGDSSTLMAVGYDYSLTQSTRFYVAYATVDNEADSSMSMSGAGRGNGVTPAAGDDPKGLSAGMVYAF